MPSVARWLLVLACVFTTQAHAEGDRVGIPAGSFAQGNSFANEGTADEGPVRVVTPRAATACPPKPQRVCAS